MLWGIREHRRANITFAEREQRKTFGYLDVNHWGTDTLSAIAHQIVLQSVIENAHDEF